MGDNAEDRCKPKHDGEYRIVEGCSPRTLAKEVQGFIDYGEPGWELVGGPFVFDGRLFQALVYWAKE